MMNNNILFFNGDESEIPRGFKLSFKVGKDLFLERIDYREVVRKIIKSLFHIAFLVALMLFAFNNLPEPELISPVVETPVQETVSPPESEGMVVINEYRRQNDLEPLKQDNALYYSALKSAKMIYDGYREWSHDGYQEIILQYYQNHKFIGENLAKNYYSEIEVFEAWKKSKTHNNVMLAYQACDYGFANYQNVYVLHIGCREVIDKKVPTISGKASYYSREGCLGCSPTMTMANGEPLDDNRLTVAYNDAPLNSYVTIKNTKTGQSVTAKVTDTGGFERHGKIIDLTIKTRDAIGCGHVCDVEVNHAK